HPTTIWTMRYKTIRRCCRYLENWRRAVVYPDTTPWEGIQTVDRWEAEIRALRAYYHLELFMNFGPIPIVDHTTTVAEQHLKRNTQEEVVKFIADEFELASKNLPVNPQTAEERWRWTKGACYAYLSYLYMFVGDWTNAKYWAEQVIGLNKYDIYVSPTNPAASYSEQFLHEAYTNNTKESILTRNRGCHQACMRLAPPSVRNGTSGVSPSAALIDAYELADGRTLDELSPAQKEQYHLNPTPADRDPRLEMTIVFPGESHAGYTWNPWVKGNTDYIGSRNSTVTGYWVKKWVNQTDMSLSSTTSSTLPFQLMRYSVVLLNYVEAAIELNQLTDPNIYAYLNKIRNRAGMPDVDESKYNTQESLRELVRRERRIELAFEGHRLIDIRRWRIAEEVMNGPVYGALDPETGQLHYVEERRFNPDRDYVWPIPNTEVQSNDNMVQNPGY
ncbi:MAG: RagB/SusD family nutrient uptake outer membrane protein, partial [Bacteroidales bacterium]|nr:RagB/SusD family nutrient uptake outer membrane protein [Bacteroidales bacterium]